MLHTTQSGLCTTHYILHNTHYNTLLHTLPLHYTRDATQYSIHTTQYTPCTTHSVHTTAYKPHNTHPRHYTYTLHATHYALWYMHNAIQHTTHYGLQTTHNTLHNTHPRHYTLHVLTTCYTLHTAAYALPKTFRFVSGGP